MAMEHFQTLEAILARKLAVLKAIDANTETQLRFVRKRQITGLQRLLGEREPLMVELDALNAELVGKAIDSDSPKLQIMLEVIDQLQAHIKRISSQVLDEAICEREKVGRELNQLRVKRTCNKQYGKLALTQGGPRFDRQV